VGEVDAADPVAEALPDSLPVLEVSELAPVADAVPVAGVEDGVMLGPGPAVIISPFPPGYVPPAAATKSGGTPVWLLAKKYIAAAGVWPNFDSSKNSVRLKLVRFVAL
jgi:hypothetical protein